MELKGDEAKEAFMKGVEETRIRNKARDMLNREFNTLSEQALWDFVGLEYIKV